MRVSDNEKSLNVHEFVVSDASSIRVLGSIRIVKSEKGEFHGIKAFIEVSWSPAGEFPRFFPITLSKNDSLRGHARRICADRAYFVIKSERGSYGQCFIHGTRLRAVLDLFF